jgi:TonB family protein
MALVQVTARRPSFQQSTKDILMTTMSFLPAAAKALSALLLLALTACVQTTPLKSGKVLIDAAAVPKGVTPPRIVTTVAPRVPFEARASGLNGEVTLECLIDENGKLQDIQPVDYTDWQMRDAAVKAVSQWTFAAGSRNGTAAPMRILVPIQFSITYPGDVDIRQKPALDAAPVALKR